MIECKQIFPTLLIILDICAAISQLPSKDYYMCVYWLSAATLTFCVTFKE